MSAENTTRETPAPTFDKTYRRADGEEIGDYGWVTTPESFEDYDEAVEMIEETWQRVSVRTYWHLPSALYSCMKDVDCDEDAVAWEQLPDDGNFINQSDRWVQVCAEHVAKVGEAAQ